MLLLKGIAKSIAVRNPLAPPGSPGGPDMIFYIFRPMREPRIAFVSTRGKANPAGHPSQISTIIVSRTGEGTRTMGLGYEA